MNEEKKGTTLGGVAAGIMLAGGVSHNGALFSAGVIAALVALSLGWRPWQYLGIGRRRG